MKYHPTPPVELVLSIVTDNEPIPSKAYKHLGFLQYFTALTKAAAEPLTLFDRYPVFHCLT